MEFDKKEFEEVLKSTLAEINSEKKSHDDEVSELNNKITELNSQIEEKLKDLVVTRAEKFAILEIIKREKLNDFEKIRIVENYVEHKI